MIRIDCDGKGGCFRPFWIEARDKSWFLLSGETFHCPNCGKGYHYTDGNMKKVRDRVDRLTLDLEACKRSRDWSTDYATCLENRIRALKGVITKMKRKGS